MFIIGAQNIQVILDRQEVEIIMLALRDWCGSSKWAEDNKPVAASRCGELIAAQLNIAKTIADDLEVVLND